MISFPEWPQSPGPRVLTLVGNDVTIDTRARKTASSLARSGFSVICAGIDWSGDRHRSEGLGEAVIWRSVPPSDPRIAGRSLAFSLPEMADRLHYRVEALRSRLQSRRRSLSAWSAENKDHASKLALWLGRVENAVLRRVGLSEPTRARATAGLVSRLNRSAYLARLFPRRLGTVVVQRRFQVTQLAYKASVRAANRRVPRHPSWRRDLPEQHKFEAAIGPIIDHLQPDLAHVHDIFHLGVAARAKSRARASGRELRVVYDAHEYIPGLPSDPRRRLAYTDLEEEYVSAADAVVTVSQSLADLLKERYRVDPTIVMNAPDLESTVQVPALRDIVNVPDDAVLAIYVGGVAAHRGAEVLLDALANLPSQVHLAFVTNTTSGYVSDVAAAASSRGLGGRVHFAPYVKPEGVVDYLRSADLSIIPLSREVINYEVALPNKLFQSIHAGLPVVVSDNPEMARFVTSHRFGEVFEGENPISLADAVSKIVRDYESYRDTIRDTDLTRYTWKSQAEALISLYARLGVGL